MKIVNPLGEITININVLKHLVYQSLLECYGLVKMDDVNLISKYLGGEEKGIHLKDEEDGIYIDVYPVVSYGMKIDQVSLNVQQYVDYKFEDMLGIKPIEINVHVLGIKLD
ncbi:MAG TPA: Asp23/Gls24 family envelope stress response protein [Thermotogota bacterium]|nr:Asp23/Gls24 family envelope stress response protein [Thermotogota bacterium]HPJ88507.1 Asp23/Gls24 family envelope stress response protein [Thermotogota bacterium]HPR96207.1 Asp23/Gls24 family envelope stress response protein [Thermotogota bacterium]